jgi:beta-lactamase class D
MMLSTRAIILASFLSCGGLISPESASARNVCTILAEQHTGHVIFEKGECDQRFSPASTFKIALALIGYDSGFLIGPHRPKIDYKSGVRAPVRDRKPVSPTIWLQDSVIWFSRELTRSLGERRLAAYLTRLDYGNQDISGEPGKNNGLTNAWVSSSLHISPKEQVVFLSNALESRFPLSNGTVDFLKTVVPKYQDMDGRVVAGKTGSGWVVGDNGKRLQNMPIGWFIGWTQIGARKIVFARLDIGSDNDTGYLGPKVKQLFLAELPKLIRSAL